MTKPIVSVALMQLYEQGKFNLTDPLSRFLPAFATMRILQPGFPHTVQERARSFPLSALTVECPRITPLNLPLNLPQTRLLSGMFWHTLQDSATASTKRFSAPSRDHPFTHHFLRTQGNGDGGLMPPTVLDGIYNQSPILNGAGPSGLFGRACSLEVSTSRITMPRTACLDTEGGLYSKEFCDELATMPLLFEPGTQ